MAKKDAPVPTTRIGRFARVAKLAGGVAGGMLAEGSRRLRAGERPRARDMLLTPANARRVADELASMRGAAMKLGQMLSMDAGDFLPEELANILARLRADADTMPPGQLNKTMTGAYGEDWEELFYGFEMQPIAAASIGQVHRTLSPDGREIVLKVQYPGVAKSIDSDVDNIAGLLRLSGLLPESFDISPLLSEAKLQLKAEANYLTEAGYLRQFGELLADDERFVVPEVLDELTTEHVLAMTYVESQPIEVIADLPQAERDRIVTAMIDLMLWEFFELRMVQTDPNFANYRYQPETGKTVLLDFGATRKFKAGFVNDYRHPSPWRLRWAIPPHRPPLTTRIEQVHQHPDFAFIRELCPFAQEPLPEIAYRRKGVLLGMGYHQTILLSLRSWRRSLVCFDRDAHFSRRVIEISHLAPEDPLFRFLEASTKPCKGCSDCDACRDI